ncbi:AzlD domain-containing protein [Mesorhizobium sp. CAU 1741]|uniref:AzlD domain-containing protein n=1 Tax=Mesorhizobium sp. CAU 1741 TaxID=3140366 RepID=UPI00325B892C
MTFGAFDAWWWPYLFILLGGWLATDGWRFLGVYLGGKITEESPALVFVRTLATALVAAVIGNLVVFPSGALAGVPLMVRVGAAAIGFVAYLVARKNMLVGILVAEAVLLAAVYAGGFLD